MKTFFETVKTSFLALGAAIGAGFISGSELVGFFGTQNFLPPVVLCFFLFFFSYLLAFFSAERFGSTKTAADAIFRKKGYVYEFFNLAAAFVFYSSMLAGLDALWDGFGFFVGFPALSVLFSFLSPCFSRFGIKGLERLNIMIMPVLLIGVDVMIFAGGGIKFPEWRAIEAISGVKAALYAFMNLFLSLPVLFASAKGKSKRQLGLSAATAAFVICVQAALILAAIYRAGGEAGESPMPLSSALTGISAAAFPFAATFATATSLFSSYYPLYSFAKGDFGKKGLFALGAAAFVLSRLGLKFIVENVYPAIGVAGAVYLIGYISFCIREKYKKWKKAKLNAKSGEKPQRSQGFLYPR